MSSNKTTDPAIPREEWLPWAQTAAGMHVLLSLIMFAVGTPLFFGILSTPCQAECLYFLQLKPPEVQGLVDIGWTLEQYALFQLAQEWLYLFTFSFVSSIIYVKMVRRRDERSWYGLLAAFGLISIGTILVSETTLATTISLGTGWQLLYELLKASGYIAFMTFCLLFPDGRFVPGWVRWLVVVMVVWMATWVLLPFPALDPAGQVGIFLSMTMLACLLAAQIYRYRRVSTQEQRQQTKWFIFGFGVVLASVVLWSAIAVTLPLPSGASRLAANLVGQGILALFPVVFAVCICISLLRYRLWDIDIILNRSLVYGTLTVLLVALYALIVASLGLLLRGTNNFLASLLATGAIAVIFQPARDWLQTTVNRLLFGERDDPARVLTRLTHQLEQDTGESLLVTLVETIAESLKVPHVALWLQTPDEILTLVAQTGKRPHQVEIVPLLHQQKPLGELVVAPRSPGEALSSRDRQLLGAIARLTATTVRTIQLTDEVQDARIRTVSARQEERRRLRRDLHDGLGPVLASQGLKLGAARQLLRTRPDVAEQLLDDVIDQSEKTVAEVRRLVYALRPPTLDEFGLVQAIQEHVETVGVGVPLQITVHAETTLTEIPAAVEVAAFRIVQEAVNNTIRHAQAQQCTITITGDDSLQVHVKDDGVGLPAAKRTGVGLLSMRERAAEAGGTCTVEDGPTGGVIVRLVLPLPNGETA